MMERRNFRAMFSITLPLTPDAIIDFSKSLLHIFLFFPLRVNANSSVSSGMTITVDSNKRLVKEARERGMLIDASYGRSTRAVLIMDSDHVVLSALTPETVASRAAGQPEGKPTEEQ